MYGGTTCRQLSKRLPYNNAIFAAEAMAITLALDYPVQHNVVGYYDPMFCLQAIEGDDNENTHLCHITNLLWVLDDKGMCVWFCWVPSHSGIEGYDIMDHNG